jgi:uncharacterized protein (DUF924 family)
MGTQPWSGLIETWFGETLHDPEAIPGRMPWWFGPDPQRDADLAEAFGDLVTDCASGKNHGWLEQAEGRLAMILALDQLPRNLFRGSTQAFAHDPYTAAICLASAATGVDRALLPVQRAFLYMPLQHFEDLAAQETGVALYQQLADEMSGQPQFADGFLPYAREHRDIIARFGRFPHRNSTLGRTSTPDEQAYLAGGAPHFGQ